MCEPATIGYILTAVGAGTQAVNTGISQRRQDQEAARGIKRQGVIQRDANKRLAQEVEELARRQGAEERSESLAGFQNALRAADETSTGAVQDVVGANPRFAEAVSQARAGIRTGANERADRLSIIDGAVLQRLNEGNRRTRTVTDLNEQSARSRAQDFITRLRIADRAPNATVNALAEVLSGIGSVMTMGAGSAVNAGTTASKAFNAGTLIDSVNTVGGANAFSNAVRFV